jgi:deoxyhypusine synthase
MDLEKNHFEKVKEAVLVPSDKLADSSPIVKGYEFNNGVDWEKLLDTYKSIGFQATNLGRAIDEINKMVNNSIFEKKINKNSVNVVAHA